MVEIDQQSLNAPETRLCHVVRHVVQPFSAYSINRIHLIFCLSHARSVPTGVNFRLITLANRQHASSHDKHQAGLSAGHQSHYSRRRVGRTVRL